MKQNTFFLFFTLLVVFGGLQAKQIPSAKQQLQIYQDLRAENHITEQQFQFKTRHLQYQIQNQKRNSVEKGGGTAEISGQIFNGGVGISGIEVKLFDADTQYFVESQNAVTGGVYAFTGLAAGNYYVVVSDSYDDYIDAIWSSTGTQFCSHCNVPPQSIISLAAGAVSTGHNLNLTVGATLTGHLSDSATGDPVETLYVNIVKPGDPSFSWYVVTVFDGSGNYTVKGLPGGTYRVSLQADYTDNLHIPEIYGNIQCNYCYPLAYDGSGAPVTLSNGITKSGINFSLDLGAKIEGFLVDSITFDPLENWGLVMIFDETNMTMALIIVEGTYDNPATTGSYTVGGLLPGTYFAQGGDLGNHFYVRELYETKPCPYAGCDRGAGGTAINLGAREHRRGINFTLDYGGKISGNITDAITGLPIDDNDFWLQFYNSAGEVAGAAKIKPLTGDYTSARALPAGIYSVRTGSMFRGVFTPGYIMEKYDPAGNIDCPGITCDLTAGNVTVNVFDPFSGSPDPESDATTTGIDFTLDTGFSFSGTITDLSSASPLADVHVLVYDDNGVFAHWATTNHIGNFTVSGLPAGTYYAKTNNGSNLPFMGLNPDVIGSWVDILYNNLNCPGSACDVTTGTPIVLGGSPDAGPKGAPQYSFELPDGGTFTGRLIHSETTAGIANTRVNVYNSQSAFYGSYESDIDGYWMTSGFPADTYYLVTQGRGGMVDVKYGGDYCFNGQCDPLTANPIVLGGTYNISNINMILKPDFIFRSGLD